MSEQTILWWLRRDLRLSDNPALSDAARAGSVIPVFIWSPDEEEPWAPGPASRWWLERSLQSLDCRLRRAGSRLTLRQGSVVQTLLGLCRQTAARAVYWSRCFEPAIAARDLRVAEALQSEGIETREFNSSLLFEPPGPLTQSGGPYRVFTPYYRACLRNLSLKESQPTPRRIPPPFEWPDSLSFGELGIEGGPSQPAIIPRFWMPGEEGAAARLDSFLKEALGSYDSDRDRPGVEGVSRLSPHLHFGEIAPQAIWRAVEARAEIDGSSRCLRSAESFLRQLVWREFAHHLLFHFPRTPLEPLRPGFARFRWRDDSEALEAWKRGQTGYPIVDAGMRQLAATGWMHNRVRMIAASFLVKDLLIPWQVGARWFWETLADADLANNTFGWQWVGGCGADAAPFFRIFNPVLQGAKFDPEGNYVRRWVPELASLPARWIHRPWQAPAGIFQADGLVFGGSYPSPIVDHAQAARQALASYAALKRK